MKALWWILTALTLLVVGLGARVLWTQPSADCTSSVVIVRGPDGRPVECVCMGGTVSTCFDPGP